LIVLALLVKLKIHLHKYRKEILINEIVCIIFDDLEPFIRAADRDLTALMKASMFAIRSKKLICTPMQMTFHFICAVSLQMHARAYVYVNKIISTEVIQIITRG